MKNDRVKELRKEKIIIALSNFDEQKLALALMYAENYLKYGIDITEKIDTAIKILKCFTGQSAWVIVNV